MLPDTIALQARSSPSESANRGKNVFVPWKLMPPLLLILNGHIIKEIACVQPFKIWWLLTI